jgi:hypothetical protein
LVDSIRNEETKDTREGERKGIFDTGELVSKYGVDEELVVKVDSVARAGIVDCSWSVFVETQKFA